MSGHSKWNNIKRKKEKTDGARAKVFTKIGREISVAVRDGGPNPASNSKLADLIAKAKRMSVPNDNIQRIIKKAEGGDKTEFEAITYEGYGPGGMAVILEIITNNRNRIASEIRHIFDKAGGSMGATGCVSWMFDKKGVLVIERTPDIDEDTLMMQALDAGASDFQPGEDMFEVICEPADFSQVRKSLEDAGYSFVEAEIDRIPSNTVDVSEDNLKKVNWMLENFEDNDDVQNVFHNGNLPQTDDEED